MSLANRARRLDIHGLAAADVALRFAPTFQHSSKKVCTLSTAPDTMTS